MWNKPTLVLNNKEPIKFISAKTAMEKILCDKAIAIDNYDIPVRSMKLSLFLPNIIESNCFNPKVTKKFSKLNVLYRDDQICSYCLKKLPIDKLTIDHVIPKSKWKVAVKNNKVISKYEKTIGVSFPKKLNSWLNCVAACKKCNSKIKKDKYLWETNLKLYNKPFIPAYTPRIILSEYIARERNWYKYLNKYNDGRIVKFTYAS